MKWKALTLERLVKVMLINQLLENQGEKLFVNLIEVWLPIVQLYYQKEQVMVMQFDATHASLKEREKYEKTKSKEKEEDQDIAVIKVCQVDQKKRALGEW